MFEIGRDAEGHSTLKTTETFVAVFPDADQNRGMVRSIPTQYEGHPTDLDLVSVTDASGTPRPVETEEDDGFLVVTSAGDDYVHGEQTYVFTYTQRNVTLDADETDSGQDEFYWDTNGTGWAQSFDAYSVTVVASDLEIVGRATDEWACYRGVEGSTRQCDVQRPVPGSLYQPNVPIATASGTELGPSENVTIAVGFTPGTFVPRDDSYFGSVFGFLQLASAALALAALVGAIVLRSTRLRDARGRGTIIAEYSPPAASLFASAQVIGRTAKATAAALVDLAVRGVLQIEERSEPGFLGREKERYVVRLVDPTPAPTRFVRPRDLADDEREFLGLVFGPSLVPGTERDLAEKDTAFGTALATFMSALPRRMKAAGLRVSASIVPAGWWAIAASFVGAILTIVFGVVLLADDRGGVLPLILLLASFVALFAVFFLVLKTPLTPAGAELRDHLRGLEEYIRLAEADRFRMLQSPDGASRDADVIELTERLLPYAVLFGQEKEWAQALAVAYEQAGGDPGWYSGSSGFNAALFAGGVSSFAATTASTWSGSSTSSSGGGASGGGSSGGGGGGGGGGGA